MSPQCCSCMGGHRPGGVSLGGFMGSGHHLAHPLHQHGSQNPVFPLPDRGCGPPLGTPHRISQPMTLFLVWGRASHEGPGRRASVLLRYLVPASLISSRPCGVVSLCCVGLCRVLCGARMDLHCRMPLMGGGRRSAPGVALCAALPHPRGSPPRLAGDLPGVTLPGFSQVKTTLHSIAYHLHPCIRRTFLCPASRHCGRTTARHGDASPKLITYDSSSCRGTTDAS